MNTDFKHLNVSTLPQTPSIWTLEFDHGKANEVGSQVLSELDVLTQRLSSADGPVALISYSKRVSAKGTPIFIAGANVTERADWDDARVKTHVRYQRAVLNRLRRAPVFHVCIVGGVALGWGTEFLITADYKIATDTASFGLPETGLGILPGAGGTSELQSLIGLAHTLRLGMTGERIKAGEAQRIGLVQELSGQFDEAFERAEHLCQMVRKKSPSALAAFKRAALSAVGTTGEQRVEAEALAYEHCVDVGEAAIGRASFQTIRSGGIPEWHPRSIPREADVD
jgi:enoyl-CoA hydratase/carnithine racemase